MKPIKGHAGWWAATYGRAVTKPYSEDLSSALNKIEEELGGIEVSIELSDDEAKALFGDDYVPREARDEQTPSVDQAIPARRHP